MLAYQCLVGRLLVGLVGILRCRNGKGSAPGGASPGAHSFLGQGIARGGGDAVVRWWSDQIRLCGFAGFARGGDGSAFGGAGGLARCAFGCYRREVQIQRVLEIDLCLEKRP